MLPAPDYLRFPAGPRIVAGWLARGNFLAERSISGVPEDATPRLRRVHWG